MSTTLTLDDFDFNKLGTLDAKGYNYEMENLDFLKHEAKTCGFKITYANPEKPHLWKRTKGTGIDLRLEVPNADGIIYTLHIEESFQSHAYYYRRKWFYDCRLPRFRNVKRSRFDIPIILTNRPANMLGVRPIAKKHGVRHIFNLSALLDFITRIRNTSFYHKHKARLPTITQHLNTSNPLVTSNNVLHYDNNNNKVYASKENTNEEREEDGESVVIEPLYITWLKYRRDVTGDILRY